MKGAGGGLVALGWVLIVSALIWMGVGVYVDQVAFPLILAVGGVIALRIGSKMTDDPNPTKAVAWKAAAGEDASRGDKTPGGTVAPLLVPPAPSEDPSPNSGVNHGASVVEPQAPTAPGWVLILADGTEIAVRGATLLGRDPVAPSGQHVAQLVPIADPEQSVSKTHAMVDLRGGDLLVRDLGSTNGTVVVSQTGDEEECAPDTDILVRDGSIIELGSYQVRVVRGAAG